MYKFALLLSSLFIIFNGCSPHTLPESPAAHKDIAPILSVTSNDEVEKVFKSSKGTSHKIVERSVKDDYQDKEDESDFTGKDRKYAKTSIYKGERHKSFETVAHLYLKNALPTDTYMRNNINPPLTRDPNCKRVDEENYSVTIKKAILCAAKKESDNDYHLILCDAERNHFFTAEISGLPESGPDRAVLLNVRNKFEEYFGDSLPKKNIYTIFKDNSIMVDISGSLFYDVDHKAGVIGPKKEGYQPKTAWEIHPVTNILFEP